MLFNYKVMIQYCQCFQYQTLLYLKRWWAIVITTQFLKTQRNIYCIFINRNAVRIYKNKNFRIIKIKINVKATNHESIHKNYLNYLIEEWKLKRCVNLYHWSVIGKNFSYVKKMFGPVVSLHYKNTLLIFLFYLESKLPIRQH